MYSIYDIWHRLFCRFTKPSLSSTTAERFRFLTKCFDNVLGNPYKISVCQILLLVFQNLSAVALLGPHVAGIRDGDNPIGRAQPKNWNLWLCHIKQRSGKKVDKVLCWKYRDWWQSIRGMTREVLKCLLLLYESKEWVKKGTRRPTEMAKKANIFIKRSSVGRFGLVLAENTQFLKPCSNPIEILRQNP